MSQQLIDRSPDLKQLRDEGFDLTIKSSLLLLRQIPYVNSQKQVCYGTLVTDLTLAGEKTTTPKDHVVDFIGEQPCDKDGAPLVKVIIESSNRTLAEEVVVNHRFSSKPPSGYPNFYEKMTAYVKMLLSEAQAIDRSVTARPYPVVECAEDDGPFHYYDTATSRAGIGAVTKKLRVPKVAIVGVGGTGSYILDFLAKTPIGEIHLFDGDSFLNHNAFRAPGAPSLAELGHQQKKVDYLAAIYSKMRRGIIPHPYGVDASNVAELQGMSSVFLSLEGLGKRPIVNQLEAWGIPFVDVGMGIQLVDDALVGMVRVTTSTPAMRNHVHEHSRIPFSDDENNEYSRNIQIAELNALNAALAVVKWKKHCGFYHDLDREHNCNYVISGNTMLNEDHA